MSEQQNVFRPEIQGLRGLAVLAVVVYHVWPATLPGGYVGVDVFFVISGFLITGILLKEVEATGRISIRNFYARRIKRLLPAATCVLLAVALCNTLLPDDRQAETAIEIAASALYVQNWWLAHRALDYLAADSAPGLLQHFWSLSVEEQYYILWPLLFLSATRLSQAARRNPRVSFGCFVVALGLCSLGYSIHLTAQNAGVAYFATTTRAWELALGGALAIFPGWRSLRRLPRAILGVLGVVGIGLSCRCYGSGTAFPGYAALLPTVSAALVIMAGESDAAWSPYNVLKSRPFQYIGDISYSLYLWHWPVVTLYALIASRPVGFVDGVIVLMVSSALAHQTKALVEDPFRSASIAARRSWQPFALGALCVSVSLLAAGAFRHTAISPPKAEASTRAVLGARALENPAYDFTQEDMGTLVPSPARAVDDVASANAEGCVEGVRGTSVKSCAYGDVNADFKIALIGDSHAVHWFPAFQEIVTRRPVRFFGVSKTSCAFSLGPVHHAGLRRPYDECVKWSHNVIEWLSKGKPDLVLISQSPKHRLTADGPIEEVAEIATSMAGAWRMVTDLGLRLMAIKPTPWQRKMPRECVTSSKDWQHECVFPRKKVFPLNPVVLAAEATQVPLLDFTESFCFRKGCPPAIGGVLVYRDLHHISATYSRTLARAVERKLPGLPGAFE